MPVWLLMLAASVATLSATGAGAPQVRLMLGIVVDGLDSEYLEILRDRFGEGGFRMLETRGASILQADYGTSLDATAATATLVTGAHPALSGVGSDTHYDRDRMLESHVFADAEAMGNFTSEGYSPRNLRVSTISDETRIASGGLNVVYAIAPTAGQAIPLAGHNGNSALWLDKNTGNWASSTFYRDMPTHVATRNRMAPLSTRLDTMIWGPALDSDAYPQIPDHLRRYGFRYVFPHSRTERFDMFAASPLLNREISAIATELMRNVHIGTHDDGIDVLNIAYILTPYTYGRADNRMELMDAYIRLDRNLEQLFATIDRTVGLDSTLIYLAGTPPRPLTPRDDERWGIPYGEVSSRRAVSLLNMYLIALHGNGDYVSAFRNGHLYLNHRLLKERGLDASAIRREAAEFLFRMSGIESAYTSDAIAAGLAGERPEALRRNTVPATDGDIAVTVAPGYRLVDDFTSTVPDNGPTLVRRAAATTAPVFIMAPDVAVQTIGEPVDIRAIAPTVARILRIRSPNGAVVPPLTLQRK